MTHYSDQLKQRDYWDDDVHITQTFLDITLHVHTFVHACTYFYIFNTAQKTFFPRYAHPIILFQFVMPMIIFHYDFGDNANLCTCI